MAMILDAFMSKCCTLLADYVGEEVTLLLGVKDELQNLLWRMRNVQSLLQDAEKRKFDESSTELWLSQLKDVMYDADDIIDLCRIEGTQLLADQNPKSKTSPVCCNFSSPFSCFTSVPLRHKIGSRIKELSDRLDQIYKDRKQFKLEKSTIPETPRITLVDSRQTSSMVDPLVVGKEVEDATNRLVHRWVDLLRVPLYNANTTVRVLITTRDENIAKGMDAAPPIHHVEQLSTKSGWDMLRRSVFHNGEEEQANELKNLGFEIVKKCGHLPLAIKVIVSVLKKEITKKAWVNILSNKAWSISKLPEELRGALYLSFEDLPSHLKQCFLYFSLYPEDARLSRDKFVRYWVAEGFITEQEENSIMEDVGEKYFNELVERNLLQPQNLTPPITYYKMHDLIRSLALFLSKGESSFGNEYVENNATSIKLRRLSVGHNLIANQGGLRTLLASFSDLMLDHERLMQLSRLRLLDICYTRIEILPDSIGSLVHLRYLDLSHTKITTIPESIEHLAYLQFLMISYCMKLTQLPRGIILLDNLRCLELVGTPLSFIPKGIGKLKQLNELSGFVVDNNDSSSQLEELNSLNYIRKLGIHRLERAKSGANILEKLSYLSDLTLDFTENDSKQNAEEQLAAEKLFDELTPPPNLEKLTVWHFFGNRFPYWMALSTFESCVSHLTELCLEGITKCTQLPPLGQMPELKFLHIQQVDKVKKIGPEFLGGGVISKFNSSIRIAFPKLQELHIFDMHMLEEWTFGAEVEENASPRLKLMSCLQKLRIGNCPLLKQLPKGLKHLAMKILFIKSCEALSCVQNLDSLQHLIYFDDKNKQSLPEWLLMLLQRVQRLQNDSNENFKLELWCSKEVLQECLEGGSYWDLIRHIPQVNAIEWFPGKSYLRYNKRQNVYDTNL